LAVLAVGLVALALWRGPFGAALHRPNILLITLDTTRADHIGAYGYGYARTPRIDRLAREGVMFERAITAAPITLPSHVSLLTGLYPFTHGVRNNGNFSLPASLPTLATALHDNGYQTAAFVSAFVLDRRYGLDRGFDNYDDDVGLERRGDRTVEAAVRWLDGRTAERPFFMWLHLYDPHDPYDPPERFRAAFADRPYDGEIAFADEVIATLLDRLERAGTLGSTIVAVVGDHGESLGEHGEITHAMFVYESTLRVPMILWSPGHVPSGQRLAGPVRTIDLAPTLLDLAGRPSIAGAEGRSLVPMMRGNGAPPQSVYGETYFPLLYMNWAPLRTIQDERWKYIDAPTPELYDLSQDVGERANVANREPARVAALGQALRTLTGGRRGAMSERKIDGDTAAKLAALGYIGASSAGVAATDGDEPRADPKAMIGVFNRLRDANAAVQAGRFEEAIAIAGDARSRDPSNAFAAVVLANAQFAVGRYGDAAATYRAYAELVPTSADAHHRIAICYARLGDPDRALEEEDAALAIDARDADAHNLRGGLLASKGRTDEALRDLRIAVDISPSRAPLRVGLARVLMTVGRLDEADRETRAALKLEPENPDAHAALGAILLARGDAGGAVREFDRSLALRPDADDVRLDFARALDKAGDTTRAQDQYRRLAAGRDTPPDVRTAARARLR
jgi:choline-sulfatase